jgi:hypothetical protein
VADEAVRGGEQGARAAHEGPLEAPSEAVLSEALSSAPLELAEEDSELAPSAGDALQRNVEEALDHAAE